MTGGAKTGGAGRRRRICVVVFSRANYGRIKSVLRAVQDHPDLELQLLVGASALLHRFGNVIDVIRADGFEPAASIYSIVEGENPTTMAKSTGLAILELTSLFEALRPDLVLTVADRFETIATAISASYMNIPVAHTQGGEVSGNIDESVRHAVTKLAHLHFPATARARDFLLRMGELPQTVHLTGCPSMDVLRDMDLSLPDDLFDRYKGVGPPLDPAQPYLVVLQHPVTSEYGQGMDQITATLQAVEGIGLQTAWLWPNVDAGSDDVSKGLRVYRERHRPDWLHIYRNFAVEDYARLINNCICLVGNSSSGIREAAFLGVPSVNIGSRQQGRERGPNVTDVGHDPAAIASAIRAQVQAVRYPGSTLFGDGTAGQQIAEILATADTTIQKHLSYLDASDRPA